MIIYPYTQILIVYKQDIRSSTINICQNNYAFQSCYDFYKLSSGLLLIGFSIQDYQYRDRYSIVIIMKGFLIVALALQVIISLDYDPKLSETYQKYSIITHCTNDQLNNWSCKACKDLERLENFSIYENKATSIYAYMGYSKTLDKFIIVMRGTVDYKNWIQDFSFYQVPYGRCKDCKIHEGFYLAYLSLSDQIYTGIQALRSIYKNKQILVIGASLGGALAMTAALEIQLKYQSVSQLHTFGCPRLGNQAFAMYVKLKVPKVIRVIHDRDIVPHVPLQSQNFAHPPYEVLFDEPMNTYKICSDNGQDPSCSDSYYPYYDPEDHVTYWTKLNVHDICS